MTHPKFKIYDQDKKAWVNQWIMDEHGNIYRRSDDKYKNTPTLIMSYFDVCIIKNPLIFQYVGEFNGKPMYDGDLVRQINKHNEVFEIGFNKHILQYVLYRDNRYCKWYPLHLIQGSQIYEIFSHKLDLECSNG